MHVLIKTLNITVRVGSKLHLLHCLTEQKLSNWSSFLMLVFPLQPSSNQQRAQTSYRLGKMVCVRCERAQYGPQEPNTVL